MRLYLGADHGGFDLKNELMEHLYHEGLDVEDIGAKTLDMDDDYPRYAFAVATKVLGEEDGQGLGILICRSGQGMSIAANRVRGIRATLAWNPEVAAAGRRDDNSNILVLAADYIDEAEAPIIVDAWLKAEFKRDAKYARRLNELEELYG